LDAHPEADTAPATAGQSGPVWFLPSLLDSGDVTRALTVPEGTALFIPVLAVQYDNATCDDPPPPALSAEELLDLAASDFRRFGREASVTVDGRGAKTFIVKAAGFEYTVASENNVQQVFCVPDGATVDPSVAVGRFVILKPLSPGEHTIVIAGVAGPPNDEPFFSKTITYTITVE
jgi:hypothetical protein